MYSLWFLQILEYVKAWRSYLFFAYYTYHHCVWLIWRHWTYKMFVRYILSSLCLRLSQFAELSLCNIWGCAFLAYSFLLRWLWESVYFIFSSANHYNHVIMDAIVYQITSLTIVYLTIYSGADQRKHQSSKSLAFVRGIHRRPVKSPHKGPVTRKMFPFDDVIMIASMNH